MPDINEMDAYACLRHDWGQARYQAGSAVTRPHWPGRFDDGPLLGLVGELRAAYPGWVITTTRGRNGPRLAAYRPSSTSGLYAVITTDPAELRHELDAASPPAPPAAI
jgi:hypothetical protein